MSSTEIVLITGGNTGLGFETVKSLVQSSHKYTILLGGRDLNKAETAAASIGKDFPSSGSSVFPVQIDVESDESIQKLFKEVSEKHGRIDTLINNAGAQFEQQLRDGKINTMREMWNKSWDVNTTGTTILTHTFAPLLIKSSSPKLLFITSGTSTLSGHGNQALPINRSPEKGWPKPTLFLPAYRSSKTGLNMLMLEWNRILKADGVKTWAISPGMLATGLGGNAEANKAMGAGDPKGGADLIRDVVEGLYDKDTGKVVGRNGVQDW